MSFFSIQPRGRKPYCVLINTRLLLLSTTTINSLGVTRITSSLNVLAFDSRLPEGSTFISRTSKPSLHVHRKPTATHLLIDPTLLRELMQQEAVTANLLSNKITTPAKPTESINLQIAVAIQLQLQLQYQLYQHLIFQQQQLSALPLRSGLFQPVSPLLLGASFESPAALQSQLQPKQQPVSIEGSNKGRKRSVRHIAPSTTTLQSVSVPPPKRRRLIPAPSVFPPTPASPTSAISKAELQVLTDERGEKSLIYPDQILNALYAKDWTSVRNFLASNKAAIFPSSSCSSPTISTSSPPTSPQSTSSLSTFGDLARISDPSQAIFDKFAIVNSIPITDRLSVFNNVDISPDPHSSSSICSSSISPSSASLPSSGLFACESFPFFQDEGRLNLTCDCRDGFFGLPVEGGGDASKDKPDLPSAPMKTACAIWKGPFRRAKGRCYPIVSFPKLKLNDMPVLKLLLAWRYPQQARTCDLLGSTTRRIITNTCGNTCCIEETHCRIKGIFENGKFVFASNTRGV